MHPHSSANIFHISVYFTFAETIYTVRFPTRPTSFAMLVVMIVLLLLTALVATEPSSPGGGDS
jgi:hypothetical protein